MITAEEQIDLFNQLHHQNLFDLYIKIKEDCTQFSLPLLDNTDNNTIDDFIQLIMNNSDLKKMYIKYYKKDNLI